MVFVTDAQRQREPDLPAGDTYSSGYGIVEQVHTLLGSSPKVLQVTKRAACPQCFLELFRKLA